MRNGEREAAPAAQPWGEARRCARCGARPAADGDALRCGAAQQRGAARPAAGPAPRRAASLLPFLPFRSPSLRPAAAPAGSPLPGRPRAAHHRRQARRKPPPPEAMRRRPLARSSRRRCLTAGRRGAAERREAVELTWRAALRAGAPASPRSPGLPDSARPLPLPAPRRRASAASTQGPRWRAAKPAPTTSDLTAPRAHHPSRRRPRDPTPCRSPGGARSPPAPPRGRKWRRPSGKRGVRGLRSSVSPCEGWAGAVLCCKAVSPPHPSRPPSPISQHISKKHGTPPCIAPLEAHCGLFPASPSQKLPHEHNYFRTCCSQNRRAEEAGAVPFSLIPNLPAVPSRCITTTDRGVRSHTPWTHQHLPVGAACHHPHRISSRVVLPGEPTPAWDIWRGGTLPPAPWAGRGGPANARSMRRHCPPTPEFSRVSRPAATASRWRPRPRSTAPVPSGGTGRTCRARRRQPGPAGGWSGAAAARWASHRRTKQSHWCN